MLQAKKPVRPPRWILCWLLLALLCGTASLSAEDKPLRVFNGLEEGLADLAKEVKAFLKTTGRENNLVAISGFQGATSPPGTSGPEITRLLKKELVKAKVKVVESTATPDLLIVGEYADGPEDRSTKILSIIVTARIRDRRTAKTLTQIDKVITGTETIANAVGATADFTGGAKAKPPEGKAEAKKEGKAEAKKDAEAEAKKVQKTLGDETKRAEILKNSKENPQTNIVKTTIAASPTSPYKIEILVAPKPSNKDKPAEKDYVPAPVREKDKLAFTSIKRDEFYAIKCYNESPNAALVQITIDGLDIFTFTDEDVIKGFFVPAGESITIDGWYITGQRADLFVVTEYAKSAAALKQSETEVGTITVNFRAAWEKGKEPPKDEPPSNTRNTNATGRGLPKKKNFKYVECDFGVVRATVSVRYNKVEDPTDLPKDKPPPKEPSKDKPPPSAPPG
jgi:hypothetical protein